MNGSGEAGTPAEPERAGRPGRRERERHARARDQGLASPRQDAEVAVPPGLTELLSEHLAPVVELCVQLRRDLAEAREEQRSTAGLHEKQLAELRQELAAWRGQQASRDRRLEERRESPHENGAMTGRLLTAGAAAAPTTAVVPANEPGPPSAGTSPASDRDSPHACGPDQVERPRAAVGPVIIDNLAYVTEMPQLRVADLRAILRLHVSGRRRAERHEAREVLRYCNASSKTGWNEFQALTEGMFTGARNRASCGACWREVREVAVRGHSTVHSGAVHYAAPEGEPWLHRRTGEDIAVDDPDFGAVGAVVGGHNGLDAPPTAPEAPKALTKTSEEDTGAIACGHRDMAALHRPCHFECEARLDGCIKTCSLGSEAGHLWMYGCAHLCSVCADDLAIDSDNPDDGPGRTEPPQGEAAPDGWICVRSEPQPLTSGGESQEDSVTSDAK